MTREDLACKHEPFGDAFYYGPERLSERFAKDAAARDASGFSGVTYRDVLNKMVPDKPGQRVFIKDMAYYLYAPDSKPTGNAESMKTTTNGANGANGTNGTTNESANGATNGAAKAAHNSSNNDDAPTLPDDVFRKFRFAFLIRHPRRSIPSYYRCTVPPLVETTKFDEFLPNEAGYVELRRLFDRLRALGIVDDQQPTVIDADDLLDRPVEALQAFCQRVGLEYSPAMLQWADPANQEHAKEAFAKWAGFHNDALASTGLKARAPGHKKTASTAAEDAEWTAKFGEEGQRVIRATVDANIDDYEYLKKFALKF